MQKKVLIVEDEKDICKYMKRILEHEGWQAFAALDGEQALRIFAKERPQACLIDIHMPSGIDGMEILSRIKTIDKAAKCIMITCVDDTDKGQEAEELGADGYFIKPLDTDKIHQLIEKLG